MKKRARDQVFRNGKFQVRTFHSVAAFETEDPNVKYVVIEAGIDTPLGVATTRLYGNLDKIEGMTPSADWIRLMDKFIKNLNEYELEALNEKFVWTVSLALREFKESQGESI